MTVCADSKSRTLTDTFCFSVVLVHERQFKLGSKGESCSDEGEAGAFELFIVKSGVDRADGGAVG